MTNIKSLTISIKDSWDLTKSDAKFLSSISVLPLEKQPTRKNVINSDACYLQSKASPFTLTMYHQDKYNRVAFTNAGNIIFFGYNHFYGKHFYQIFKREKLESILKGI